MNNELLIIAGEASGDQHGASLIKELRALHPDLNITGIGGNKMQEAGMELLFHIRQMAFLGFAEVVRHLPFIKKVQRKILGEVAARGIKTVVLIDYPGFNLNIAAKLKKLNVKIIYYISPQIWAWGQGRVEKIKRLIDKVVVILPFEEKFFRQAGVDCEYVGHPLLEQIAGYSYLNREEFFEKYSLDKNKKILLVLPGSRKQEVSRIFPETIKGALRLADEFNMQVIVACSSDINEKVFYSLTDKTGFKIIKDRTYDLYRHSEFGIIKSGTSTLEAALFGLPMVVVYATNRITYLIGRTLIKIDTIGLVNIVAGKKIIHELIQDEVNEENIFQVCSKILGRGDETENIKKNLGEIRSMLGAPGASARCASVISGFLKEQEEEKLREKNNF